jgi:hypothetical protein
MPDTDFFQKIKFKAGLKVTKAQMKKIRQYLGTKDETAEPVYEDPFNLSLRTYVWDTDLADTEIIPWKEDQAMYLAKNVAPYAPDYHVDESKTRIGYEIPFTREFYRYTPLKPSSEIFSPEPFCLRYVILMSPAGTGMALFSPARAFSGPIAISENACQDAARFDGIAADYIQAYLDAAQAAKPCDPDAKRAKAAAYSEGLLKNGGPATDPVKAAMGEDFTAALFRETLFGA